MAVLQNRWHSGTMRASHARQLGSLEACYRELLLSALHECAAGRWSLFAHNESASTKLSARLRSRLLDPAVQDLLDLGSKIERLRGRFGLEPFPLHQRLLKIEVP